MPKEFGRIAAQTARQVITQKLEKLQEMLSFQSLQIKRRNYNRISTKADGGAVIMDLGRIEGIMPKKSKYQQRHIM